MSMAVVVHPCWSAIIIVLSSGPAAQIIHTQSTTIVRQDGVQSGLQDKSKVSSAVIKSKIYFRQSLWAP